jgi:hypothetical protein
MPIPMCLVLLCHLEDPCSRDLKYEKIIIELNLRDLEDQTVRHPYLCVLAILLATGHSPAQTKSKSAPQSTVEAASKEELTPEQIIEKFAAKEEEFFHAWTQYAYLQSANIRVLSVNGAPQNEGMTLVYEVVFNDDGSRELKLVRSSGALRSVHFTEEDKEVIQNINPFALTMSELPLYNLKYEGKEKVDELDCYVFSVSPKSTSGRRLFFKGKIWVDNRDLQVVKTVGMAVPQTKDNQFPEFETIRQMIDNKYWFPVWTHADSQLKFPGQVVRIEETITYGDYKRFGSKATITFDTPEQK